MMRVRLNTFARSRRLRPATALALAGMALTGCVQTGAGLGTARQDTNGIRSIFALFDENKEPPSDVVPAKAEMPALVPPGVTLASAASATAPAVTTRILVQQDDLRLRPVDAGGNSYQLPLPRLTALGDKADEGETVLVRKVQEILNAAGSNGQFNTATRAFAVTATPEQARALAAPLDALRQNLGFARYTFEVWTGSLPTGIGNGTALPVDGPKGSGVSASTVAAAAVSQPRLEGSGGRRLQQDVQLVLIGAPPMQFSYTASVDYIAASSSLAGSMNMTVERFPTRLSTQMQTRRLANGTETTLTLIGKGLETFREENTAGMNLKVPLPKTFSIRIPFMPVADKVVLVSGLKGFGQPCTKTGQYCPYELSGDGKPQEQGLTLIARSVVYVAEVVPAPVLVAPTLPPAAGPAAVTVAEGKASLKDSKVPASDAVPQAAAAKLLPPAGVKPQQNIKQSTLAVAETPKTVRPVWNQKAAGVAAPGAVKMDSPLPEITPAPVKPVAIAKSAEDLPESPKPTVSSPAFPKPAVQATEPPAEAPKGFRAKPILAPVAVIRGTPEGADKAPAAAETGAQAAKQSLLDLMTSTPKGKLVERPVPRLDGVAAAPLPKDPAQVDWAAWDAELEASVGGGTMDPALAAIPAVPAVPASVTPPAGATIIQKPSGVHVFRGAPGVKISPEAMKRLMELDARQARTGGKPSRDTTLLGQLRDKAHLQGVMMEYEQEQEKK